VETYLTDDGKRNIGVEWWLRSKNHSGSLWASAVSNTGYVGYGTEVTVSRYIRPAMVITI
ncbi:MAG: hypothetical protein IKK20_02965, partial [Clostridia bacterium]|nr:hypothetical protein [Clostridia bacterium]